MVSTKKTRDIESSFSTRNGSSKWGSLWVSQRLKVKWYSNSENESVQPNTHLCLSMLWCHLQPTWELHLHPALCNHSVIMSHCTSFLFNNLLAVFHIKWIIQQQTLFLVLTTAAVILHAHRVSSKVCWKRYLLSSSILCNSRWGSESEKWGSAQLSGMG